MLINTIILKLYNNLIYSNIIFPLKKHQKKQFKNITRKRN